MLYSAKRTQCAGMSNAQRGRRALPTARIGVLGQLVDSPQSDRQLGKYAVAQAEARYAGQREAASTVAQITQVIPANRLGAKIRREKNVKRQSREVLFGQ